MIASIAKNHPSDSHTPHPSKENQMSLGDKILFMLAIMGLIAGWMIRDEKIIIAEEGLGYILGIVGGSLMLLLLLYPLRKKAKWMRNMGNIKYWFQMHMMFGVLGPVLILYHSSFHLGSTNSNVALYCMLLVACSGLVGRYFYTKIHHGLYGRIVNLNQLADDGNHLRQHLKKLLHFSPELMDIIESHEKKVISPSANPVLRAGHLLFDRPRLHFLKKRIMQRIRKDLNTAQKQQGWRDELRHRLEDEIALILDEHFQLLEKIAHFRFFDRMFSLWHLFHYPFFLMMVISAIIHVIAVHAY